MIKRYESVWIEAEAKKLLRKAKGEEDGFISFSDLIKKRFGKKNERLFPKF